MALEPPKAKNDTYWKSRDVNVNSMLESRRKASAWYCISNKRKSGTLVARDWVRRKRVKRSWRGREISGVVSMSKFPDGLGLISTFHLPPSPYFLVYRRKACQHHHDGDTREYSSCLSYQRCLFHRSQNKISEAFEEFWSICFRERNFKS